MRQPSLLLAILSPCPSKGIRRICRQLDTILNYLINTVLQVLRSTVRASRPPATSLVARPPTMNQLPPSTSRTNRRRGTTRWTLKGTVPMCQRPTALFSQAPDTVPQTPLHTRPRFLKVTMRPTRPAAMTPESLPFTTRRIRMRIIQRCLACIPR